MASSKQSARQESISESISRAPPVTSMSSRTKSAAISTVVIALGSNLGDRRRTILRAIEELRHVISIVRISSIIETEPVDAPPPKYLNAVVLGYTRLSPE